MEDTFRPFVETGLLILPGDFLFYFAGFSLFFPQCRKTAPKLRALFGRLRGEGRRYIFSCERGGDHDADVAPENLPFCHERHLLLKLIARWQYSRAC